MSVKALPPFLSYYGGKWRLSKRYPPPQHRHIIEPFAGSAGYSHRYHQHRVTLVEKSAAIAAVWKYLIRVSMKEILGLPVLRAGEDVRDLTGIAQEARWLIGLWINPGSAHPKNVATRWVDLQPKSVWGDEIKMRIASNLCWIRHWEVIQGDYQCVANQPATWFIDPPYGVAGTHYPCDSAGIDYDKLSDWCLTRRGQSIVCEAEDADWLPFQRFVTARVNTKGDGTYKPFKEGIWVGYND